MTPLNIEAALSGLSAASRRCYSARIRRWITWAQGSALDREHVRAYVRALELQGCSPQVLNQSLAALKRFAVEAAELGWIDLQVAAQVQEIKAKRTTGIRTGRWLAATQSSALLEAPDRRTLIGRRDAAVIALLLGCGLRRSEVCALTVEQVRTMQGRMFIVNVVGKGGRVRSAAVPQWAALGIQRWIEELEALEAPEANYLLRSITNSGTISGSLSPSAVRDIVRRYGAVIGVPDLNPQDIRRTCARLARLGGAPLETIQHTLGHASAKTTEIYTRCGEEANAGDFIDVKPASSGALHDLSYSLSLRRKAQLPPQSEPPADLPPEPSTPGASPAPEPLQPSAVAPHRAPGTSGRRPPKYPDLSYQVIGAALGISPTYVGRILNGHNRPSMRVAERLAALMGWSIDQVNELCNRNKTEPAKKNRNA